jgi:hypothetical protein
MKSQLSPHNCCSLTVPNESIQGQFVCLSKAPMSAMVHVHYCDSNTRFEVMRVSPYQKCQVPLRLARSATTPFYPGMKSESFFVGTFLRRLPNGAQQNKNIKI